MYLYFLIVYKRYGAVMCKFLDFMDSPSQTYMKWPLVSYRVHLVAQFLFSVDVGFFYAI